uniref:Uncharacterized protein n=1 Tax=Globisporangium ultimum (strain ATCC 200006 / CBS 805.95 / DAOM BR144) TaxID=431595 RepID=K3X3J0_GLOUD
MATRVKSSKSVSMASSVLFDIEEDHDDIFRVESSPTAIERTVRTLSSPPRKMSKPPARAGAVSNATTVASSDDRGSQQRETFAFQQQRKRARSRKPSIYATWSCCGMTFSNLTLRALTSILMIPAVVVGLLASPRLAIALVMTMLMCVCAYEYAWLAFRIHHQLLSTYNWYEGKPDKHDKRNEHGDRDNEDNHFQSFVSGYTQSTSYSGGTYSISNENDRNSFEDPAIDTDANVTAAAAGQEGPSPLDSLFFDEAPDILFSVAESWFGGRIWLARIPFALVLTAIWSLASYYVYQIRVFPVAALPKAFDDFPYYFWIANLLASVCALAAPNVKAALSLVLQKEFFTMIMLNTINCPISSTVCETTHSPLEPLPMFMIGMTTLLLFRSLTATNPADLVISATLDMLGFVYIVGSLGLLVATVDTSHATANVFVHVLLLLLCVAWIAELAGYCCDAFMYHFRIRHMKLFPAWLALKFNIEAAILSIAIGVTAMLVGSELLDVPGSMEAKVASSILGVLSGRLGRLFTSLLKKAAGVRWSSRLLPGYGGVLDAVSMLLFASVIFVPYFVYIGTVLAASRVTSEDNDGSMTSVDFSTAFAS